MPSPNVQQGTLNRIRASVIFPTLPFLNITSPFLGRRGITLVFEGTSTVYIDTMTGAVTSPEPYLRMTLTVDLIKSQAYANQFKTQLELSTLLGPATVRPDAAAMQPFYLENCAIINPGDLDFNGTTSSFPLRIGGIYQVNSSLYTG